MNVNPAWVETLMGFPEGWTELQVGLFDGQRDPANHSTDGSLPAPPSSPIKPND